MLPPAHPACRCFVVAVSGSGEAMSEPVGEDADPFEYREDYGYGEDVTGTLSREAHNWLQAWQFGFTGGKGTRIPVPSRAVADELARPGTR